MGKRSKTRHEYYVRDKSRLSCSLPRKTRLQIRTESRKKMMQRLPRETDKVGKPLFFDP